MTVKFDEVLAAIQAKQFGPKLLLQLSREAGVMCRRMEREEAEGLAKKEPLEIVKETTFEWGLYGGGDYDHLRKQALDDLNAAGCRVVLAIRKGNIAIVKQTFESVKAAQRKWSKAGADDTEGREALWALVEAVAFGSDLDADTIWETCY